MRPRLTTSKRLVNVKESAIEGELVRRVRACGGLAEKTTVIGYRGFFDRLVILPGGKLYFVECKRPRGGRISPHQARRHAIYRALGAVVKIVLTSGDIEDLLAEAQEKGPRIG